MLVMVVFFIAFRWIHLSTPLIRLFLLVLILLLMPTLNFVPVWFALSLLRFRLPSRLPMMFFFFKAEDGIRDVAVTGVQTCALPISPQFKTPKAAREYLERLRWPNGPICPHCGSVSKDHYELKGEAHRDGLWKCRDCREQFTVKIGRASCRERV